MIYSQVSEPVRDSRLTVKPLEEQMVWNGGLQPFLVRTRKGTMICQLQMPERSHNDGRIVFHWRIATIVSRDGGVTWQAVSRKPGENELYMEGGGTELRDGSIVMLDTYVTPHADSGYGAGLMNISRDEWKTVEEPVDMLFHLPDVNFYGNDDGGNPHHAIRLHRRVIELPDGDLLACLYGWFHGDNTPSTYVASMMKCRSMLLRSGDQGETWKLVSTIAVDPEVGAEGFVEPDFVRLSQGPYEGRLLCFMRTGRELYGCHSDDEGVTWSEAKPVDFGVADIYRTEDWAHLYEEKNDFHGYPPCLHGAYVDPNIIELKNGVLALAFGLRIPEKLCWLNPSHERNGNYIAFSFDQGATWSHVLQLTSGILTTHYMSVEEIEDNLLYVMYDHGHWDYGYWNGETGRYTCARKLELHFAL
ncbi:MAG: exo-alpha-sialidase [Paenibacillaceae bacterium]|nr:exo-alpha-sialidase [Paenibacillaceae bacterium]